MGVGTIANRISCLCKSGSAVKRDRADGVRGGVVEEQLTAGFDIDRAHVPSVSGRRVQAGIARYGQGAAARDGRSNRVVSGES